MAVLKDLKVLNWNLRRAKSNSPAWEIIKEVNADILTLQEISEIPDSIKDDYTIIEKRAVSKNGREQTFSTAILAKGFISNEPILQSDLEWVNNEIAHFNGNLVVGVVTIEGYEPINVISVYSPAWPLNRERLSGIDITSIKLTQNPDHDIWCTEILWSALRSVPNLRKENWIISGDFNSSVTFDQKKPRGNQEIIDRLNSIGLTECLYNHVGKLTPTFRNPCGGKVIHQLDHVYVTPTLYSTLTKSCVGDNFNIFEKSISDHLPIISTIRIN